MDMEDARRLLQKARDLIEFSPIFGIEATNLVRDIDQVLSDVPVKGRWTPDVSVSHGMLTVKSIEWRDYAN